MSLNYWLQPVKHAFHNRLYQRHGHSVPRRRSINRLSSIERLGDRTSLGRVTLTAALLLTCVTLTLTLTLTLTVTAARVIGASDPPSITEFNVDNPFGDTWNFYGTVVDENPAFLVIRFGEELEGHQVGVDADGTFTYIIILGEQQEGLVTAQTTDDFNQDSNVAEALIDQG